METKLHMVMIKNSRGVIWLILLTDEKCLQCVFLKVSWEIGAISFSSSYQKFQKDATKSSFRKFTLLAEWTNSVFLVQWPRMGHDLPGLLSLFCTLRPIDPYHYIQYIAESIVCFLAKSLNIRLPLIFIWRSKIVIFV